MERLQIVDNEGFLVEVDNNYCETEKAKEKLKQDPNADVVFIAISYIGDGEQMCAGITLGQAKELIEGLQSLIKELEE